MKKNIQNCLSFLNFFLTAPKAIASEMLLHSPKNTLIEWNTWKPQSIVADEEEAATTSIFVHEEAVM